MEFLVKWHTAIFYFCLLALDGTIPTPVGFCSMCVLFPAGKAKAIVFPCIHMFIFQEMLNMTTNYLHE